VICKTCNDAGQVLFAEHRTRHDLPAVREYVLCPDCKDGVPVAIDLSAVCVPTGFRRARIFYPEHEAEFDVFVPKDTAPMIGESDETKPTKGYMQALAPELEPGVWKGRRRVEYWSDNSGPTSIRHDEFVLEIKRWCDDCQKWSVRISPTLPGQVDVSCAWPIKRLARVVSVLERVT
jgi:hypothetical protein